MKISCIITMCIYNHAKMFIILTVQINVYLTTFRDWDKRRQQIHIITD